MGLRLVHLVTGACVTGDGLGRPFGEVHYHAADRLMQYYVLLLQTLDEQHM